MMSETKQPSSVRRETKQKDSRWLMLALLLLLLIVAGFAYILLTSRVDTSQSPAGPAANEPPITQPAGERFEFSAFYHADDGLWVIRDEGILVLKEQKYILPSEKDEYTVHDVIPGECLKILESDQRWKRVAVYPATSSGQGEPVAAGWVDANNVRQAERVEADTPATTPASSNKAMKQQYPH